MVSLEALERAFNHVRSELCEVGLLADGVFLDDIEACLAPWVGAAGWYYADRPGGLARLAGFESETIYVNRLARLDGSEGNTLRDVVRHEFGHAWAALDPGLFDEPWFKETFGGPMEAEGSTRLWRRYRCDPEGFRRSRWWDGFASPYALYKPSEDFAETFMLWLKHRERLDRLAVRRGLYRKLQAVEGAARRTAGELGLL